MPDLPEDFRLDSYYYHLPEELISQAPAAQRDRSRLLILDRASDQLSEACFVDLAEVLPAGALLVANNTKVLPARLYGHKPSGGKVEFLLLTPLSLLEPDLGPDGLAAFPAEGLLRASKPVRPGDFISFGPDFGLRITESGPYGRHWVRLELREGTADPLGELKERFKTHGHMPLPPYIKSLSPERDRVRYQTIYAREDQTGSVAAPTAGLHFTPELKAVLRERGFGWTEVTLHVGYGTFSPVRHEDIRQHVMHAEYVTLPPDTAAAIQRAKEEQRPVVAVGTTSLRAVEGAYAATGAVEPYQGWTDVYMLPGKKFNVINGLITNFHLPGSSLLILVSALAGRARMLAAYQEAVRRGFRFFSYGDAMLIR